MKEIIKKYREGKLSEQKRQKSKVLREVPQTLFWIINFFLTIILWCCLCLITHVFLTRVTGVI